MAFSNIWNHSFVADDGTNYTIQIDKDGYTGSASTIDVYADGITLSYKEADDIFSPIRGSQLSILAKNSNNFDYSGFYSGDYGDYRVYLINKDTATTIWTGFSQPENINEPFIDFPYPVKLTFSCGLGELKNFEFTDTSSLYGGQKSIIELVRLCLNKLNPLNIREAFNVYDNLMSQFVNDSPLALIFTESSVFRKVESEDIKGLSCYNVLNKIMTALGCFITQHDNKWHIIRVPELTGSLYYREFTPNVGTESTVSVSSYGTLNTEITALDKNSQMVFINSDASLNIENRIRKFTYNFKPQKQRSAGLFVNGNFKSDYGVTQVTGTQDYLPNTWTENAPVLKAALGSIGYGASIKNSFIEQTEKELKVKSGLIKGISTFEEKKGKEILLIGDVLYNYPYDISTAPSGSYNFTDYIEVIEDNIIVKNLDKFNLEFIYNNVNSAPLDKYLKVWVIIHDYTSGIDYYYATNSTPTQQNSSMDVVLPISDGEITHLIEGFTFNFSGKAKITLRIGLLHNPPIQPSLTSTPTQNVGGGVAFKSININYKYATGLNSAIEQTYTSIIDDNHDEATLKVDIGQGKNYMDFAALRDSNTAIFVDWARRDVSTGSMIVESLNFWEVLAKEYLDLKSSFNRRINGSLHKQTKELTPISRVKIAINTSAGLLQMYFIPIGYEWNVIKSNYAVVFSEISENIKTKTKTNIISLASVPPTATTGSGGNALRTSTSYGSSTLITNSPNSSNYPV